MPIACLRDQPDKAGHLFHARPNRAEYFHKPVNPWAFANRFNAEVAYDPVFRTIFDALRA